ncbi:MAG: phage virion morphogenesis protein [Lentisphaerae bacterium RIFOXYA12_FULL_48_11]|nr:MAG: phage virion morphogenesis protein [Lentisphaerae bacterium RIFOXYA12_FULL_48_11]
MAGDGVLYTWDDKDLQDMIAKGIGRINDMTPVMKNFADYMVLQTDTRFRDEEAPDGSGWQELKPATSARKEKMKGAINKILQQGGYLRLVHPHHDKDSAGVFSDRVYAAIHNRGGFAGPGRKVKIHKREFLGFNDADIQEFVETCKDWIIMGRRA